MQVEILTIGDELCRGEIVDTNAAWLAQSLWELDIPVIWMTSCRDVDEDIRSALECAAKRADVVITSGGLGPTCDDLTVDVVASLLGVAGEVHEPSRAQMETRLKMLGIVPTENQLRQVRAPAGATVYRNPAGAAPGFEVRLGTTPVFSLPGPPRELKAIFEHGLRARLIELREAEGRPIRLAKRIYRTFGRGESQIAGALDGLLPDDARFSLHYQVQFPEVLVKVVVRDPDAGVAGAALADLDSELRKRLGKYVYGIDSESLPAVVGAALSRRGQTVATAESCTGGLIGALLTDVPGSSAYYLGGVVAYHDQVKQKLLGVKSETLARDGAVSEATVVEMAAAIREKLGATWGISVSGIAGPSGGTEDKPVGTVWFALAGPDTAQARKILWPGSREDVRKLSAHRALSLLLYAIEGGEPA